MDPVQIKKTVDAGQYANLTQAQKDLYNSQNAPKSAADYIARTAPSATVAKPSAPLGSVLSPEQQKGYYAQETPKADPLSPLQYLATKTGTPTGTQTETPAGTNSETPGMEGGMYVGYDAQGNKVLVGNKELNPQYTYGADKSGIGTSTPAYSRTTGDPMATPTVETEDQIVARKQKQAQEQIDSLNKYYDSLLAEQSIANDKARRSTSSISTLTGLAGSTEAAGAANETEARATQANKAINNERNVAIQSILANIRSNATTEARQQRLDAAKSMEDAIAIRKEMQAQAVTDLQNLTAGGVTFDGLKKSDPASFKALADQFGGEAALKGAFVKNIPQDQILDKRVENGKYIIARMNPITGKTSVETLDLGIPAGYSKSVDLGNQIMFMPDNFDPSNKNGPQPYYVAKGLSPKEQADRAGGTGGNGKYTSDLDALIGRVPLIIPSENGKAAFNQAIKSARDDGDKVAIVATSVLRNSPAPVREDFANQSIGIKNLEKAISILDQGTKTGLLNNAAQYTYNLAGKDFDPKIAAINSYVISAIQPYRNSITGAAWGTQEDNEYQQLFGSTKYSPTELRDRLVRIKEIMKDKSATALNAQVNPIDTGYNPFQSTTKKTIDDYRQEFPQATDEELNSLMREEQG